MHVTLIHNPSAGDGAQFGRDALLRLVRAAGHDVTYQSTKERKWATALQQPADLIAVAGGDGTIAKVAKRILGRGVPLTVLPMGTANNIARTLGLADRPLVQLVGEWNAARKIPIDAALATGPWGRSYFIESLGIGLLAWTIPQADASSTLDQLDGAEARVAYALQMLQDRLRHCPAIRLEASLDGNDISGEYVLFEALNMQFVGPNLNLAPCYSPGDGLLDVVVVTEAERPKFQDYLASGRKAALCPPELTSYSGRHVQIEWSGFDVHLDDKVWPENRGGSTTSTMIDVGVETGTLEILAPL